MLNKRYFVVHGTTSCPFCVRAVGLLESKNISYIFSPIDGEMLNEVKQKWDHKTVPIVVERDLHNVEHEKLVGGYDDLTTYLQPETIEEGGACVLDSNCD